ncbi:hypothetical protein FQA39_LY02762 [Lamprigera yunnana]|nr:hypothetical protein FQA39_LY02762 [Lamprigera yunnana]
MYRNLFHRIKPVRTLVARNKSEPAVDIEQLEQQSAAVEVVDEDAKIKEEEIQRKRNKSGLKEYHRNMVLEEVPYPQPTQWLHGTLKYRRNVYGRYGSKSGFNVSLCWPTKEELSEKIEFESTSRPFTILQMVEQAKQKRLEKEQKIQKRQEEISKKLQQLGKWKLDLKNKIEKKESDALIAKEQKEKLVEEVRRHFGYTVNPHDEKFIELLEKKEKEQQKARKEARKKLKEEKMMSFVLNKATDTKTAKTTASTDLDDKENT